MEKKRLAIVGANAAITMLIEKAKYLGFETHVFSWKCGDPGEKAADVFYPISIDHKEEIAEVCRKIGVMGVCSITSDFAAPTVSYVAHALGLPCNPEITGEVARNKYKMRCAFRDAGIYTPPFRQLGSDYSDDDIADIQYPVIVKPTDRWSSKGVTRVNSRNELDAAVKYAIEESFDKHAIVEGFMDGPEYSAECICSNGQKTILAFTQKQTTGFPNYIESGHLQPALLNDVEKAKATEIIMKALSALYIENGAAHVEFRLLPVGEVGIIEIGARMGGDCIGTDLTPISTGMDYIKMVIDIACGKNPDFRLVTKPETAAIKFIMNENDYRTFLTFKEKNEDKIVRAAEFNFDWSEKVVDSSTRHGYYIPEVIPQDGLLAVEHIRAALGVVGILQVVGEHQGAFVVNSDGGVHIVGQEDDLLFHGPAHSASSSHSISVPIKDGNIFLARLSTIRKSSVNR